MAVREAGWPDPTEQADVKPRLLRSAVLHREQYDVTAADAGVAEYDQLAAYHATFGREGTWTERVLRRLAGPESLAGRDRIREALANLGWPSR